MVYALLSLSKKHAECHIIPVRGYTSLKVLVFFLHHPFRAVGISGEGASSKNGGGGGSCPPALSVLHPCPLATGPTVVRG